MTPNKMRKYLKYIAVAAANLTALLQYDIDIGNKIPGVFFW